MPRRSERLDALGGIAIHFARDPGKIFLRLHALQHAVGILADHLASNRRGVLLIGDFAGHGKDRIDLHGHRQFLAVAVVDDAALRRDFHGALLLALRPLHPFAVVQHLQDDQPHDNEHSPDKKKYAKLKQARLHVDWSLAACRHRLHLHRRGAWKIPCAKTGNAGQPELRRKLQASWRRALNAPESLEEGRKTAPFQGNTAMTARTGDGCAKPAPEPSFA